MDMNMDMEHKPRPL